RLPRLGKHRQERLSGGAGGRAGAGDALHHADDRSGYPECRARPEAQIIMSSEVIIAPIAPIQGSRVGHLGFAVGLVICGVILFAALFGNMLVPHDPFTQNLNSRLSPPFWMERGTYDHLLGSD